MKKSFIKILFYEIARMIKAKKALFLFCVTLCVFDALLAFGYIFFIGKLTESLTLLNSSAVKNTVLYVFGFFSFFFCHFIKHHRIVTIHNSFISSYIWCHIM